MPGINAPYVHFGQKESGTALYFEDGYCILHSLVKSFGYWQASMTTTNLNLDSTNGLTRQRSHKDTVAKFPENENLQSCWIEGTRRVPCRVMRSY